MSVIDEFPRAKARTLRFTCGAPRSATVIGDGSEALFLRSDGPEDLVTALWLSWFDADGRHHETKLADPRDLLGAHADSEDVPAEEKARRERAREGGTGIVSYSVCEDGDRVVFTINGRLYLTEIDWNDEMPEGDGAGDDGTGDETGDGAARSRGHVAAPDVATRELAGAWLDEDPALYTPVLNPRISPDGDHVLYTTGERLMLVDIGDWPDETDSRSRWRELSAEPTEGGVAGGDGVAVNHPPALRATSRQREEVEETRGAISRQREEVDETDSRSRWRELSAEPTEGGHEDDYEPLDDRVTAIYGVSVEDEDGNPAENTWRIGLAEFVAGEEMDRYDGFWWAPDSHHVLFESFNTADEPTWYIADPADPEQPAAGRRYPRALTRNADVYLTALTLDFDADGRYTGILANADVDWDNESYEYVAAVRWTRGHDPIVLVQNRRQTRDQVLQVTVARPTADHPFGSTHVMEEHANDQWIDLVAGTPALTPDGRLVSAWNDMAGDTNRLTVDGHAFTPLGWNVRTVLDVTDDDVLAVVQRDARSFDVVSLGYDGSTTPVTTTPGVWTASRAGRGIVVSGRSMAVPGVTMEHSLAAALDANDGSRSRWRELSAEPTEGGVVGGDGVAVNHPPALRATSRQREEVEETRDAVFRQREEVEETRDAVFRQREDVDETESRSRWRELSAEPTEGGVVGGDGVAVDHPPALRATSRQREEVEVSRGAASCQREAVEVSRDAVFRQREGDAAGVTSAFLAATIANHAAAPGFTPNVTFTRLGEHRLYTAIVAPSANSPYAHAEKLPVLMKPYGGPGFQQVVAAQSYYWDAQWWADQGFLVVTADGRGTTGRGPRWDREIFENMKDVTLADQVEAVRALPDAVAALNADGESRSRRRELSAEPTEGGVVGGDGVAVDHPPALRATSRQREEVEETRGAVFRQREEVEETRGAVFRQREEVEVSRDAVFRQREGMGGAPIPAPDLDRVAMIGWSYGGFLSALAVLDAPDVFAAACAGAPPTDWTLYDTHYTERYLGLDPAVYERNSIVADAPKLSRPLMIIHGFADDNVTIAHSLRLSQALMAAGRPHTFLPLTGITHMTNDETVAENLLTLQRDFLKNALA
ncbi:prolyl oligopeptidase family serine peptidase [Bifidobacterium parmae]|nr:prolyl oligopeptidase family serine peptidase [Bifidobacterium parmae]